MAERTLQKLVTTAKSARTVGFLRDATLVFGFALATALGAQMQIPLPYTPVPITLQTLFVVLAGLALGPVRGTLAMATYLTLGFVGAPFFAMGVVKVATTGYLIGFLASALVAGKLGLWAKARRRARFGWLWAAAFIASLPTLGLGAAWLKAFLGVSWAEAWTLGIMPFLAGDVVKTTLAAAIAAALPSGQPQKKA